MMYPFSLGDLRDSTIVLSNYMENAPSKIPWADLRYVKQTRRDVERSGENRRGKGRRGERRDTGEEDLLSDIARCGVACGVCCATVVRTNTGVTLSCS